MMLASVLLWRLGQSTVFEKQMGRSIAGSAHESLGEDAQIGRFVFSGQVFVVQERKLVRRRQNDLRPRSDLTYVTIINLI